MTRFRSLGLMLVLAGALGYAQGPPPAAGPVPEGPPPPEARRPPMEKVLRPGPRGRWWNNPEMEQRLGLTADQQRRMDDIFQQNRLKLIDLNAAVEKEEVIMEPLMQSDQPDEAKIVAQIDRVAQARAELEKTNARFLLAIRRVLNADQWKKLQAERPKGGMNGPKPAAVKPPRR